MANLKLYTEEFIHDRQASVREARDRAKAKKAKGQKLTPAKQELAESKLQMKDREEIARI